MSALDTQVGGDHYKSLAIQPIEYAMANKLDMCQANVVKYVTRFRSKGGIKDLEKAKHMIDLLIDFERAQINLKKPPMVYPKVVFNCECGTVNCACQP